MITTLYVDFNRSLQDTFLLLESKMHDNDWRVAVERQRITGISGTQNFKIQNFKTFFNLSQVISRLFIDCIMMLEIIFLNWKATVLSDRASNYYNLIYSI